MKKLYKVFATAFAMALVFSTPQATITSHAFGFNADAPEGDHSNSGGSIDDIGSPDSGSSSSSSYDGGSSESYNGGSSYDAGSGSSDNGGS